MYIRYLKNLYYSDAIFFPWNGNMKIVITLQLTISYIYVFVKDIMNQKK